MGRQECGSNAMVTVQMTVEEYLEMKSRQEAKEVTTKQKNRPPSGDRFIVVAQEKAVQYRRSCRKSPPVPPFSKEMKSKNDPLGMSDLLSVMPDPPFRHARPDRASLTRRIYRRTPSLPDTSCNTPSSSPESCR